MISTLYQNRLYILYTLYTPMSTKGANQLDLVGQYLSGILIPRINAAQTQPTPYEEMASLLEVVTVLDEDGGLKDEWLPRLQQVDRVAQAVQGIDATTTYAKRDRARNYLASRLLPALKKKVWELLHAKGYFKMDDRGVATPTAMENKSGAMSGPALPGIMSSRLKEKPP